MERKLLPRELGPKVYTYAELKMPSRIGPIHIDVTKRETYLSDEEFQEKFQMTKAEFEKLAPFKKQQKKKELKLF